MKRAVWVPAAAMVIAAFAWAGCDDDEDNGGGAGSGVGGSGGSLTDGGKGGTEAGQGGSAGSSTDAGTGGGAGTAGSGGSETDGGTGGTAGSGGSATDGGADGGANCTGDWTAGGACGTCLETKCCDTLAACGDVLDCIACLSDPDPNSTACTAQNQDPAQALYNCADTNCNAECLAGGEAPPPACDAPATSPSAGSCITIGGKNECNPVTNAGCTGAGEACDLNQAGDGYECYPAPNTQTLCQDCSSSIGFCQGGMTCFGKCMKYCCADTDCGSGTCDKSASLQLAAGVGVCVLAGDGGVGDAGTDGAVTDASTD